MITTERHGRNLHIIVEGVDDPYVIRPLPGNAGVQVTETYLGSAGGIANGPEFLDALIMAVDGAVYDPETRRWAPVPEEQRTNYNRLGMELRQAEAELVIMPAFFWQSILGDEGVRLYLEGGEGTAGALKATGAMAGRLRILQNRPSPLSALVTPTRTAPTPTGTSTPRGGKKRGKRGGRKH